MLDGLHEELLDGNPIAADKQHAMRTECSGEAVHAGPQIAGDRRLDQCIAQVTCSPFMFADERRRTRISAIENELLHALSKIKHPPCGFFFFSVLS